MKTKISKIYAVITVILLFGVLLYPGCKEESTETTEKEMVSEETGDYTISQERGLRATLAFLPKILESPEKGVFVDLVKAIDNVYEGEIEIKVFPFPRSLDNIIEGKADFHMPMIRNKLVSEDSLPYRYATEPMGYVYFVIYSNKDKAISRAKIQSSKNDKSFPYRIETMRGFETYFDFPTILGSDVPSSLQKVNAGRVDAFVFAQEECDYTIKQLKLKNIHREVYDEFDDVMVIPKGERGKEVDKIISSAIRKLKDSNKWQKMHLKVHLPYQKWQPHDMGW